MTVTHHSFMVGDSVADFTAIAENLEDKYGIVEAIDGPHVLVKYESGNKRGKLAYSLRYSTRIRLTENVRVFRRAAELFRIDNEAIEADSEIVIFSESERVPYGDKKYLVFGTETDEGIRWILGVNIGVTKIRDNKYE